MTTVVGQALLTYFHRHENRGACVVTASEDASFAFILSVAFLFIMFVRASVCSSLDRNQHSLPFNFLKQMSAY